MKRGDVRWLKNGRLIWLILIVLIGGAAIYAVREVVRKPPTARSGPIVIEPRQLVLDSSAPQRTRLGALHFLGAWQLVSPNRSFGGLSALAVRPDGAMLALNDDGVAFVIPQPGVPGVGTVKGLPHAPPAKRRETRQYDSEAMAIDPATGKIWIGYELLQRICRFSSGFGKAERCRNWPEMKDWPVTKSIESMARLPDGRFLVISEGAVTNGNGRETLLFAGDPVAADTPHPVRMTYVPPPGYDPTDMVWIGRDRLLVLNRRATLYDGFTVIITLVDIKGMKQGAVLKAREVTRLAPPVLADNFEGMALEHKDGQRILWLMSDDNFLFFQRTLLLKFTVPERF